MLWQRTQGRCRPIQSQAGLPLVGIGAMAGEAAIRQDRADVAIENNVVQPRRGRRPSQGGRRRPRAAAYIFFGDVLLSASHATASAEIKTIGTPMPRRLGPESFELSFMPLAAIQPIQFAVI